MKKRLPIIIGILVVSGLIMGSLCFYIVEEGYQAVVLRFGKIVDVQTKAGLKLKLPFFFLNADEVQQFPKKLLSWDGDPQLITTEKSEAQFIWVDTTARWLIRDPELFYESLGSKNEALKKLDDIIDSSVRTVINGNLLSEIIRNTKTSLYFEEDDFDDFDSLIAKFAQNDDVVFNYISSFLPQSLSSFIKGYDGDEESIDKTIKQAFVDFLNFLIDNNNFWNPDIFDEDMLFEHARTLKEKKQLTEEEQRTFNRLLIEAALMQEITESAVKKGRSTLSTEMLVAARGKMYEKDKETGEIITNTDGTPKNKFGIELKDIVIRQIRYSDELRENVFQRMIKERNQLAEKTRSEGKAEKEKILGELEKEVLRLESEGKEEADKLKGTADAEVTKLYAQAYNQDKDFFKLWRYLESYKKTLPAFKKTLSSDADYFDYLYNSSGR